MYRTRRASSSTAFLTWTICLIFAQAVGAAQPPSANSPAAQGIEFFEKKIRPLLVKRCYECHGAEKPKGNLRLDAREGWQQGGDSGPAIVPGDPDKSLLIEAIRYNGYEMPPTGKLPAEEIALFEQWVKIGAPDPRVAGTSTARTPALDIEAARRHWSYQPLRRSQLPVVKHREWPRGRIDSFILARLEHEGLTPSADADRPTLIRRLYFDLIGLPPTPEQVDAFVNDSRSDAYERLVDDLLKSPHYGERWGRHWLDVVRFGESVTLRGFTLPEAWRYRDYVISAFNRDLPYDRFLQEQLAGDLLPADTLEQRQRQLVATTFLTLGNTNYEEQDKKQLDMDVVDEQLDTIGKALLAQTIGCARCHDHKFDPIPTKDYYALAGILRSATAMEHSNVSKWIEMPLPLPPEEEQRFKAHESALAALKHEIKLAKERMTALAAGSTPEPTTERPAIVAVADLPGILVDSAQAKAVGDWMHSQHSKRYIGDGYLHDKNDGKGEKTLTFQSELTRPGKYEVRLAYSPGVSRAKKVPVSILHADGETEVEIDQQASPPIEQRFVSLGKFRFEQNQGYVLISNEGTQGHVTADAVQFLPLDDAEVARPTSDASSATTAARPDAQVAELQKEIQRMEKQLKQQTDQAPKRPMVMTLREEGKFVDLPIHIRGSVHNLGAVAPRGFLQVASVGPVPQIDPNESGRRQLAEWIASPSNPLTARVMVNRVWHWLFGAGLVRTMDTFGTTGEAPSHPELLDDLSSRFIDSGWSIKTLVREVVLSRSYQMSSAPRAEGNQADPENRLLWRMNRRRLDAEAIRDSMLQVSGQLRHIQGGPTYKPGTASDYGYQHQDPCRSVYVPVFRNALPDLFEVFDFPDPSMVVGRRNASTVAPQALFLMNHPFVMEQSRHAAKKLLGETSGNDAARIERLYQTTLGRVPTEKEARIALDFIRSAGDNPDRDADRLVVFATLYQTVFASPDFRYLP